MTGFRSRNIIRCITVVFIVVLLAITMALGEHAAWDCLNCGRTGNTGNYCGSCENPAPWMSKQPVGMHYYEEMHFEQTYVLDYYLHFDHDASGRITTVKQYDSAKNFVASVDQRYDDAGHCIKRYSLGTSTTGLSLSYDHQFWENGYLVGRESSTGMSSQEYNNNEKGNPLTVFFYDMNGNHYMTDTYSYDKQDRIQKIHRECLGYWELDIEYMYEGDSTKPYRIKWGDGSDSEDHQYTYEYDNEGNLISETETCYYNNEVSIINTKTYEY